MKRLLIALMFFAALFAVTPAQSQATMTLSDDTLVNAVTEYATLQLNEPADLLSISYVLTKVSGTVAGTVLAQGSIDGTNYVNISTDTLTLANAATNVHIWTFVKSPYKYYRTKAATTGTQVSVQAAKLYTRKPPR